MLTDVRANTLPQLNHKQHNQIGGEPICTPSHALQLAQELVSEYPETARRLRILTSS